jgi:hypothetical protein
VRLGVLARSAHGRTQAIMLAHGFSAKMLADLISNGLATIEPGTVRSSGRQIDVMWMMREAGDRRMMGVLPGPASCRHTVIERRRALSVTPIEESRREP